MGVYGCVWVCMGVCMCVCICRHVGLNTETDSTTPEISVSAAPSTRILHKTIGLLGVFGNVFWFAK